MGGGLDVLGPGEDKEHVQHLFCQGGDTNLEGISRRKAGDLNKSRDFSPTVSIILGYFGVQI